MNTKLSAAILAFGVVLLAVGLARPAHAQTQDQIANLPGGTVLEASVESSTDRIIFPASLPGSIQARACDTCEAKSLPVDAATRFNLGGQLVTLQQMAQYCRTTSGKSLTVHYRLSDSVVSLVAVLGL